MSRPVLTTRKSTIVRILVLGAAGLLGSGCSALPERSATALPCPPARLLVCDTFASERRCACSDTSRVDRQLGRASLQTAGPTAW